MHTAVHEILGRCGTSNPVLPPTELYNEGWLLRLVLDWLDRQREIEHPLSFMPGARWYSEALLPSRFLPRTRGDRLAESFTHADGLIGHFDVDSGQRGDARLRADVQQFIVTEAKLGSKLSRGTKNAPDFDQAARNVACIAHMLSVIGVAPLKVRRLGFFVVAPLAQIESGVFGDLVTKQSIEHKVRTRLEPFAGAHEAWFDQWFLPTLRHIELGAMSWEAVLDGLPDEQEVDGIRAFYAECLRFNPLRIGRRAVEPTGSDAYAAALEQDRVPPVFAGTQPRGAPVGRAAREALPQPRLRQPRRRRATPVRGGPGLRTRHRTHPQHLRLALDY